MKEDQLQMACASYLDHLRVLYTHVANERQTSPMRGAKLKKMGVKRGVPDILIFDPIGIYNGLAIELKVGRNKPTEDQHKWMALLRERGWLCAVARDFDEFKIAVDSYFF